MDRDRARRLFQEGAPMWPEGFMDEAGQRKSINQLIADRDAEIARLNELASCGCGDGFTASDPGICGNCTVQYRLEIDRLTADNARLTEELESHAWEISPAMAQANIDALNAQLAEARDAWAVAISVPQMQVRVASISHAGWLMLRAALEVKP